MVLPRKEEQSLRHRYNELKNVLEKAEDSENLEEFIEATRKRKQSYSEAIQELYEEESQ